MTKNRIYGCAVIKAINANYNADFTHQPRTLPNGKVYATDKALKYLVKNYLKDFYQQGKIFYFKTIKEDFSPRTLEEAYRHHFPEKDGTKKEAAKNLLACLDIRLFGATFALKAKEGKKENIALSIHGPVQINHGINIWYEDNIYSEQIMAPFANQSDAKKSSGEDETENAKGSTTLGRQSKLQEGHYIHHFSINPKNLEEITKLAGEGSKSLSNEDLDKLKEALRKGATYYDSSSKAGIDNELLLWIKLKEDSKLVLPNLNNLVLIEKNKDENNKVVFDLTKVSNLTKQNYQEIESIEIYYLPDSVSLKNVPDSAITFDITNTNKV